jgi:Zn-dependent M28 family amino/carboxypeptidase
MVPMKPLIIAACLVLVAGAALAAESPWEAAQREVSITEIETTLRSIDHDRTSGREGERKAALFLEDRLTAYGVAYARYEAHAYLSWPGKAELSVLRPRPLTLRAITHAFGASTPAAGLTAELVFLPQGAGDEGAGPIREAVRGKIVVADGLVSPDSVARAERAGAAGLIHVNDTDTLHEMIATTIWGTPTSESAARIPRIPVASIGKRDGDQLRALAGRGGVRVRLLASVERGWRDIPLIVAEVPGSAPEFALVATHLDAWYSGMTDTAGTVASILEMARVLQHHKAELKRGVRFAWWPGHSFGRYAGSGWYVDRFLADLDRRCVAYTNLDGSGRRGSRLEAVESAAWPGLVEWSRSVAERVSGRPPAPPESSLFRPGRDSDSAFQGLGIPEFAVGVPGPPDGHPDVEPKGLIGYWHTAEDTLDKLDLPALELDTRYRIAQIYELATLPLLPHELGPIATSYVRALQELATAAPAFELKTTREAAERLKLAADHFDALAPIPDPRWSEARNGLVMAATHRLNSTLYTKAGRFDQDPAATLPILPLLARAKELATLAKDSDTYGFLETELVRGRNAVEATLVEATQVLDGFVTASSEDR